MKSRAVITGLGAITALGRGVESQAECLAQGTRRMAPPTLFDPAGGGPVAEVRPGLIPPAMAGHENVGSRALRMAGVAVDEALESSGASLEQVREAAILVGTTSSGILEGEEAFEGVKPGDPRPDYRHFDDQYVAGAIGRALARTRGIQGTRVTISTACSSSASALAQAAAGIELGRFSTALVVGVDSLTRMTYFGFGSLGLISPVACRPFDASRQGLTLGEGAACLLVEEVGVARARKARIRAVIRGWARGMDGHHIAQPDPGGRGIEECIRAAMSRADVVPGSVDHVNAHGTGTAQNDLVEGTVIARVFGPRVPVTSTKSYTGHTLGAAGALEALFSVISLERGFVPPTLGVETPDPRLDIDVVTGGSRSLHAGVVLSNSFGFGGSNCCVVLAREDAS